MKFLTSNFVQCSSKQCVSSGNAFPLTFSALEMVQQEAEFDPEFLVSMLERIDWAALVKVANDVSIRGGMRRNYEYRNGDRALRT